MTWLWENRTLWNVTPRIHRYELSSDQSIYPHIACRIESKIMNEWQLYSSTYRELYAGTSQLLFLSLLITKPHITAD